MLQVEMTAKVRKVTGKGAMRQLRKQNQTPAVVYGAGSEGLALQLETMPLFQQLLKIYRQNAIVTLKLDDGNTKYVLVKDVQTDPIKDTLIHVDFEEIDVKKPRVFEVPINYVGNAKGCDLGGFLNVILDTLAVEAAPLDVPDDFTVDISALMIGDTIQVDTIDIPKNLQLITDADAVCVSVVSAQKTEADADADAEGEETEETAAA